MDTKPYDKEGKDYHLLWNLINRIPSNTNTAMVSAVVWYHRLADEMDIANMTCANVNTWISLFARIARLCHNTPEYSSDDWVDALIHFPRELLPGDLLALDDGKLAAFLDAAAQFKRETYSDMEHERAIDEIIALPCDVQPI